VIPDFCYKALVRQTPFEIFGDGKQVRTFTHARDIASAVALLLERGPVNEDFNICGEATLAMDALAERVWRYVNPHEAFPAVASMPTPSSDVRFRIGVSEKLQEHIGWSPQYDIDFIIQDTCAHVEKRLRGGEGLASVRH
jgi:nucleoside-diphosphate-sugar epimerase